MTRLALYLQDAHTITEAIAFAQYAEERGFESLWVYNHMQVDPPP